MLYAGKNIRQTDDTLSKVNLEYLYHAIKEPKGEIQAKIRNLRIVKDLDTKRYAACKRELPYIVCANFNPAFRRTENFVSIEYFIIDIDHIEHKGISLPELRLKLESDPRIVMLFVSPSEDGLKLLFHLDEKCYDSGIYSVFYKKFVAELSLQYGLDQVVDTRTSDVCRACFISYDPNIYFNKDAERVSINQYVHTDDGWELYHDAKLIKESHKSESTSKTTDEEGSKSVDHDPDAESIDKIKEILKLRSRKETAKSVYVPEQLNDIMDALKQYIEETGIRLNEVINIQYGKKIRCSLGIKAAEVNLFYGKRGFSVIISPRSGTNSELNALLSELIESFIQTL